MIRSLRLPVTKAAPRSRVVWSTTPLDSRYFNGVADHTTPLGTLFHGLADEGHLAQPGLGGVGQHLGDVTIGYALVGAQVDLGLRLLLALGEEALGGVLARDSLAVPEQLALGV